MHWVRKGSNPNTVQIQISELHLSAPREETVCHAESVFWVLQADTWIFWVLQADTWIVP